MTRLALELTRHGKGPTSALSKAQLCLLAHPGSTHSGFVKAAQDQHGEGLGSFLGGLAKGVWRMVDYRLGYHGGLRPDASRVPIVGQGPSTRLLAPPAAMFPPGVQLGLP